MKFTSHRWAAAAALALASALVLPVPGTAAESTEERLEQLEGQLRILQAEIQRLRQETRTQKQLEAEQARQTEEMKRQMLVLTDEVEKRRLGGVFEAPTESRYGLGPSASKIYQFDRPGVSLGGYGEVLFQSFDSERDDGSPSGKTDEFDFLRNIIYFGYKFTDNVLFNSEIEFEHASTGKDGSVSVEFAYLDFLHKDLFNVRAGMVLIPLGFINELHEPTTFLGARRPDVERNIIPTTWRENGLGLFGERGMFSYRAYLTAGLEAADFSASSGLRGGRQKGSKSLSDDFALSARFDVQPTTGLLLGASAYVGDSGQGLETADGRDVDARVTLWDLHAQYRWRGLDARALYTQGDIDDTEALNDALGLTGDDAIGEELEGWYAQVGWDVLSHLATDQELVPFVRWEEYDTQAAVAEGFFSDPANDREVFTLGLTYRPLPRVVIKLDWQDVDNGAGTGVDQWNVALGYNY